MDEPVKYRRLFDPRLGAVLGLSWGCSICDFLESFPEADLIRDSGDLHSYSLKDAPVETALELTLTFLFRLDALLSVDIELRKRPASADDRTEFIHFGNALAT